MPLYLDVRVGERIQVGPATLTLIEKSGHRARLAVDAPADIIITRPDNEKRTHQTQQRAR